MFRGRYEHALDAKGRTSLPAKYRDALNAAGEGKLVLTTGLERCVVAYPMQEWLAFEERLASLPQFDASVSMLRRIYVSGAVECDLDRLGRLVIPATLRDHGGLQREVLWAGMGTHAELWAKGAFDGMRERVLGDDEQRARMAERLSELGL